jgi:hypothetical protein
MIGPSKNAFLNFTVVRYATPDGIRNQINQHFQQQSSTDPLKTPYPDGALDGAIHFSVSPGNKHHKQARVKINNTDASQAIVNFFHNIEPNSNTFPSITTPPTGIDRQSVDTRPPINNSFPTNCQFIGCQLHHLGIKKHPSSNTDQLTLIPILEKHGLTFHSNLLQTLPTNMINSIGWFRCTACPHIAFTAQKPHNSPFHMYPLSKINYCL